MKRKIQFIIFMLVIPALLSLMESCDAGLGADQPADGKMMFWSDFDGAPIDVWVDNNLEGTIGQFFTSTPECGSDGCVTVTLVPDSYTFYAEEENKTGSTGQTWHGTFTIKPNSCGALNLTLSNQRVMIIASQTACSPGE